MSESVKQHEQRWAPCSFEKELLPAKEDKKQKRVLHQAFLHPSYNNF